MERENTSVFLWNVLMFTTVEGESKIISLYGSSYDVIVHVTHVIMSFSASLLLLCFLFLFISNPKSRMGSQDIDGESKTKKRELHELLNTKIVKSGTIRLATSPPWLIHLIVYMQTTDMFYSS